ncbi:hypothetical protein MP638_006599 [Amoeboaphelidium occidentale]|nr:hypothetical protein MP638_006599 [Amoeboaphelidium occidentale]
MNIEEEKELDLSHNNLPSVPSYVMEYRRLVSLDLSNNLLDAIPEEITQLKSLEYLYLNNNMIQSLPNSMYYMVKLRVLNLNKNHLTTVALEHAQLSKMLSLKTLLLADNCISSIPLDFRKFVRLKHLALSNNKTNEISHGTFDGLVNLDSLTLSGNPLHLTPELTSQLSNMKSLKKLAISFTKMSPKDELMLLTELRNAVEVLTLSHVPTKEDEELDQFLAEQERPPRNDFPSLKDLVSEAEYLFSIAPPPPTPLPSTPITSGIIDEHDIPER